MKKKYSTLLKAIVLLNVVIFPYLAIGQNKVTITADPNGQILKAEATGTSNMEGSALVGINTGNGYGGYFQSQAGNASLFKSFGAVPTIGVENFGTGTAAIFRILNSSSTANLLELETNATAFGLYARNTGNGTAAYIANTSTSSLNPALYVENKGFGSAGSFVNNNASSSHDVMRAFNEGSGNTGYLFARKGTALELQTGSDNTKEGLLVSNYGLGIGVKIRNNNINSVENALTIENEANSATAVKILNTKTTNLQPGLFVSNTGSGHGGHFMSSGTAGFFENTVNTNSSVTLKASTNGTGNAADFQVNNTVDGGNAMAARSNGPLASLFATNTGTSGQAARISINNAANTNGAIEATTNGTGYAGKFNIFNTSSSNNVLQASTSGLGTVALFETTNTSNQFPTLKAVTNGTGAAGYFDNPNTTNPSTILLSNTNGLGRAANFSINNSANPSIALNVYTNGTGNAGYFEKTNNSGSFSALAGKTSNGGAGVYGENSGTVGGQAGRFDVTNTANSAYALYAKTIGTSAAGVFQIDNATNNANTVDASTNGTGYALFAKNTGGGVAARLYSQTGRALEVDTDSPTIQAAHFTTNGGPVLTTSGGNMGIGTLSPTKAGLVVDQKVGGANALFGSNTSGVSIESGWPGISLNGYFNANRIAISTGHTGGISMNPANGLITIYNSAISSSANSTSTVTDRLVIDNQGNVGINVGFTSPTAKLEVIGTANSGTAAFRGTSFYSHFNYNQDGSEDTYIRGGKAGADVLINDVTGLGNVGVGTATPSQKLHVAGNICYTGTIGACSDQRFKTDFAAIESPLAKITSMNGLYYHWRVNEYPEHKFSTDRQLGFIAQEVEKIFPEMVLTDSRGYKSVDYGRLTPVLVEALKEQQAQIEALKNSNAELKASLEQRLGKLEALLTK